MLSWQRAVVARIGAASVEGDVVVIPLAVAGSRVPGRVAAAGRGAVVTLAVGVEAKGRRAGDVLDAVAAANREGVARFETTPELTCRVEAADRGVDAILDALRVAMTATDRLLVGLGLDEARASRGGLLDGVEAGESGIAWAEVELEVRGPEPVGVVHWDVVAGTERVASVRVEGRDGRIRIAIDARTRVADVVDAVLDRARRRDGVVEVVVWDGPTAGLQVAALERAGLRVDHAKQCFERPLGADLPDAGTDLQLVSLASASEARFVRVLARVIADDPNGDVSADAGAEWLDLRKRAGVGFDPRDWFVITDGRRDVGVLCCHPRFGVDEVGTLLYVGLVPDVRGLGLGRAAHALGLAHLAAVGATRYRDATDARNAAMQGVFRANGCVRTDAMAVFRSL